MKSYDESIFKARSLIFTRSFVNEFENSEMFREPISGIDLIHHGQRTLSRMREKDASNGMYVYANIGIMDNLDRISEKVHGYFFGGRAHRLKEHHFEQQQKSGN